MELVPFSAADVDLAAFAELRVACRQARFLPTFRHGVLLDGAMPDPADEAAVAAMRQATHQEVRRFGIRPDDYERVLAELADRAELAEDAPSLEPARAPARPEAWDFHRRSVREVAVALVQFAFAAGASDLILDEQEHWMDAAIKLAGRKELLPPVEKAYSARLIRAFKEMAGLSTHTVIAGQSGFASLPVGPDRRADLRIEVTPTVHGESLVARLQDRQLQLERMRRLPFTDPRQLAIVSACLRQRQGLIIVTGPTGHGKTTTLYACLGQLDRSALNIRTLEDPVEFAVPWITQIPVGAGTGRSFGDGLKSLLRQAPHVILMGEIRDAAVARTCIEAADTGHLILATVHARDAVGVISRLLDLDLSGRQIAGALVLAIGQRLVRRLCPHCRQPAAPTRAQASHFERYGLAAPPVLFRPGACPRCGPAGECGLTPLFELFHPAAHDELEEAIGRASREAFAERALRSRWIALGGSPLVREGLRLAAAGAVAYEEIAPYERNPPAAPLL